MNQALSSIKANESSERMEINSQKTFRVVERSLEGPKPCGAREVLSLEVSNDLGVVNLRSSSYLPASDIES